MSEKFYAKQLGLDLKARYGSQALFLAAGNYHHHLAVNIWRLDLVRRESNQPELQAVCFSLSKTAEVDRLKKQLEASHIPYAETDNQLLLRDPSGLSLIFES
nr:hypothetical protein [Alkalibacterium sp. AK22]